MDGYDQLLRDVMVHFKPPSFGTKNIYVRVTKSTGVTSGWLQKGTWTASDEEPPDPVSVVPYLGTGFRQSFDFALSDVNGNADIANAEFLLQANREQASACMFRFDRAAGVLTLLDDKAVSAAGTLRVNTTGKIHNSQCTVSDPLLTAESNDSLMLRVNVEFAPGFAGRRNIYARAEDTARQSSRWRWLGSWIVPSP